MSAWKVREICLNKEDICKFLRYREKKELS